MYAFETFSRLKDIIRMDVLWAEGYRAESVSSGDLDKLRKYIENQAQHHREKSHFVLAKTGKM